VVLLVVAYYFFPSFVKQALSWYACYPIDDPVLMHSMQIPYPKFATADARHGYWILDMQQPCWEGWHRDWGWGLGFPCVIIFCIGAPAAVWLVLWTNKSNLTQRQFKQHFGFLYHSYSDGRWWYEVVVMGQTIALVIISVFQYTLGTYYSVVLTTVLLIVSLELLHRVEPSQNETLHHMQITATACLLLTTCILLGQTAAEYCPWQVGRQLVCWV
jgi:hypothetical protein